MDTNVSALTTPTPDALPLLTLLYRTCIDGERGFTTAAADVESTDHRIVLVRYAEQRAAFADALAERIDRLCGVVVDPTGTLAGEVHGGWLDVKRAMSGRDQPLLRECARGEAVAMRRYDEAMKSAAMASLPTELQRVIAAQYEEIVASHEHMERLARAF